MSCTLVTVSTIGDVTKLRSLLNPVKEGDDGGTLIDQSFEWNWEEGAQTSEKEKNDTLTWLTESIISLSPIEDFLVVAKKDIAIFLSRKWSSAVDLNAIGVYEIGYHGSLCSNEKESISSVLCVPLASQQRSSQGSPDWTCVVVGYTSGYIRIFAQSGVGILSQFLHDDAVIDLKIRTKLGIKRAGEAGEQVEELLIFYKKAIVVIDGFSLYQSLRACRNQIAKAQASGASDPIQPPPLAYRKWILQNQRETTDVANCGIVTPCLFDRLQSASFLGGFNAVVKGSAPAFNHYVISGSDPFLAIFQAMEGVSPALLSDVAFQVASKLTSAVFSKLTVASLTVASGWLGIGRSQLQSDQKSNANKHVEKGTTLASRFGLQDRRRRVSSILLSPTRHLCACTDDFGRVLLIETFTGSVVRMWKGYRDAQCGWLLSEEEDDEERKSGSNQQEQRRKALFLVIYGPRRGILEIWLTEQGVRVGAFNIGKDCRLICQGYTVLGRNIGLEDQFNYGDSHQCFLLKSNGEVQVINVPFHCALSTSHSLQARDAHLMKRLTAVLDKGFSSYEKERLQEISKSLISIVQEIQVPSSQMKATQLVVSNLNVSPEFLKIFLREVVTISSKTADNAADREDLEYEAGRHTLISFCHALIELTDVYVQLVELNKENSAVSRAKVHLEDRLKDFAVLFHLPVTEAKGYLTSVESYVEKCLRNRMPRRRSLAISELLSVSEFIACFEMPVQVERIAEDPVSSKTRNWRFFKGNLSKEKTLLFGSFLYEDAIVGTTSVPELALVLDSLSVPARQQMDLLVKLTESDHGCCILEWPCIKNLYSLISSICSLEGGPGDEDLQLDEDESWWDPVRDVLSSYGSTGPALVTALVCRSVAMEAYLAAQKLKEADTDAELSKEGWEPISVDMEVWNLLVHRLDDLVALDCFLHTNHTADESYTKGFGSWLISDEEREALLLEGRKRRLHIPHSKSARAVALLSVQGLLENGHGAVACLVATCLAQQGVPGPCLGRLRRPAERSAKGDGGNQHRILSDDVPDTTEEEEAGDETSLLQDVKALRKRFPYSLDQDVLWVHCCWECIMLWKEDVEEVPLLYTALLHLSCIHCTVLKQGLGQMMWKTVYKEIVMSFSSLMEKVGKAPKERLCRKTVGMSYGALEKFFATGQKLLEIMSEESNFENEYCPMFKEEVSWQRKSKSHRSIEDQAVEEPSPDPLMLQHYWSLVVVLRLSLLVNIKGFRPLSLYDTKGKHLLTMALSSSFPTSLVVADDIVELQLKFCSTVLSALVKRYRSSENDENARSYLQLTDVIWKLANYFSLEDDNLRSHYAVTLYSAGLDTLAYEASLLVHQKEAMARKLLQISGARLAFKVLEEGDTESLTGAIAILPTHITSWLQTQDVSVLQMKQVPLSETLQLLVNIVPYFAAESKDRKFTQELIENVKFLNQ